MPPEKSRRSGAAPLSWSHRARRAALRLVRETAEVITRHRIAGLAGEAAFFTLTSLPPLLFGLVGTLGYLANVIGADTIRAVRTTLEQAAGAVLSPRGIDQILRPALDEVLTTGQAGVVSIGFVLVLWSGSTALHVFIDAISTIYALAEQRSLLRQRLLSLLLYTTGLLSGLVLLPLLVVGPGWIAQLAPAASVLIHWLYWPGIALGSIASLTALYALSVPVRTPWHEHLPGAVLALALWLFGSFLLRLYLALVLEHSAVYGALAAPIGLLFWLYITAFAVLLGAATNSELDTVMPNRATARARAELATRTREGAGEAS
ncbi:YihY/virulence factor BrkB family protein [Salinifilum ghardaiensis]